MPEKQTKCGGIFDVEKRIAELAELEGKSAAPGFWDDGNAARVIIAKTNRHRAVLNPYNKVSSAVSDALVMIELAEAEPEGASRDEAVKEVAALIDGAEKIFQQLRLQSLLGDEMDANNAFVTIHSGAGGTESCDWADMLFRMYTRYCEQNGFAFEVMDFQAGDEAGIKSVTFSVSGSYAYGYLKSERGVHRLVRISPFDSNKRRHTSFTALDIVPEVEDDIDVDIDESDLRVDTYRSSGAGGQHVNKTDSAIRITHIPTGIIVACQAERSQHKNRAKAMSILKAKLYEWTKDQKKKEMERFYAKKGEIAWGSQIRSYVLQPYTMVKDHRTGFESSNVSAVLDGELEGFIEAYLKKNATQNKET